MKTITTKYGAQIDVKERTDIIAQESKSHEEKAKKRKSRAKMELEEAEHDDIDNEVI